MDKNANKIFEMNVMENRLKQLDQQLSMIEQQMIEDKKLMYNLNELENKKKVDSVFPIGGGIFFKGSLEHSGRAFVSIGSGVLQEKSFDESKKFIERRIGKLEDARKALREQVISIMDSISELSNSVNAQQ